jgi:hypothetical protein
MMNFKSGNALAWRFLRQRLEIASTTTRNLPTQVRVKPTPGRLRVLVATNLFGNIAVPEFFLEIHN